MKQDGYGTTATVNPHMTQDQQAEGSIQLGRMENNNS